MKVRGKSIEVNTRPLLLLLLRLRQKQCAGTDPNLVHRIREIEEELAEVEKRKRIQASRPKRGRPRKRKQRLKRKQQLSIAREDPQIAHDLRALARHECRTFDPNVPSDWNPHRAADALEDMAHDSEATYNKCIGYGFEELSLWLKAAAAAFDDEDIGAASYFTVGAIEQTRHATHNLLIDWALLGLEKRLADRRRGRRSPALAALDAASSRQVAEADGASGSEGISRVTQEK